MPVVRFSVCLMKMCQQLYLEILVGAYKLKLEVICRTSSSGGDVGKESSPRPLDNSDATDIRCFLLLLLGEANNFPGRTVSESWTVFYLRLLVVFRLQDSGRITITEKFIDGDGRERS